MRSTIVVSTLFIGGVAGAVVGSAASEAYYRHIEAGIATTRNHYDECRAELPVEGKDIFVTEDGVPEACNNFENLVLLRLSETVVINWAHSHPNLPVPYAALSNQAKMSRVTEPIVNRREHAAQITRFGILGVVTGLGAVAAEVVEDTIQARNSKKRYYSDAA